MSFLFAECQDQAACNYQGAGSCEYDDECGVCGGDGPVGELCPDGTPVDFQYNQSTMQAFYYFYSFTINGLDANPEDWVGAFNGDVCVGARKLDLSECGSGICDVPVLGNDGSAFTSGYMMGGQVPTFKIFDFSEQKYYDAISSGFSGCSGTAGDTFEENCSWSNFAIHLIDNLDASTSITGCTDSNACNYDENATEDGDNCNYPEENYDCDGICIVPLDDCEVCGGQNESMDCAGVCGGNAYLDTCGVCDDDPDNDNVTCTDCAGNVDPCSDGTESCIEFLQLDQCGVCDGDNSTCEDCEGIINGPATYDECGVCNGPGAIYECGCDDSPQENFDCDNNCIATGNNLDENGYDECGVCGGVGSEDNCGICDEDPTNDCDIDCTGAWGGSALEDDCGICTEGNTGLDYNYLKDCKGVCNGSAVIDNCGICDDISENDNTSCWFMNINASITNNSSDDFDITATDNNNVIGMHINADDGWNSGGNSEDIEFNCNDCYVDVPEISFGAPGGSYLTLHFPHPNWNDLPFSATSLTQDIRYYDMTSIDQMSFDYEKIWNAVIESNVSDENLILEFELSHLLQPFDNGLGLPNTARFFINRGGVVTEMFSDGSTIFNYQIDDFIMYEELSIMIGNPKPSVTIVSPNGGEIVSMSSSFEDSLTVVLEYTVEDFIDSLQLILNIEDTPRLLVGYGGSEIVDSLIIPSSLINSVIALSPFEGMDIIRDVKLEAKITDLNGETAVAGLDNYYNEYYIDQSDGSFIIGDESIDIMLLNTLNDSIGDIQSPYGWHLITSPLDGVYSIDDIILSGSIMHRYQYVNGEIEAFGNSELIDPNQGIYIKYNQEIEGSFSGNLNTESATITINSGWNLIGNPLISDVDIANILVDGNSWEEAVKQNSIAPVPLVLDHLTGTHIGVDILKTGDGFWVYSYKPTIVLTFLPQLITDAETDEFDEENWQITLSSREHSLQNDENIDSFGGEVVLGVNNQASDIIDYEDQMVIPFNSEFPFDRYAKIEIVNSDTSLYQDLRNSRDYTNARYQEHISWDIIVQNNGLTEDSIKLSWEFNGLDISNYNISLVLQSGEAFNMLEGSDLVVPSSVSDLQVIAQLKTEFIGCMDPSNTCNFSSSYLSGDEDDCLPCSDCQDPAAVNFNPAAELACNDCCFYPMSLILPEEEEVARGDDFEIEIKLQNDHLSAIEGIEFVIEYNPEHMIIESITPTDFLADYEFEPFIPSGADKFYVSVYFDDHDVNLYSGNLDNLFIIKGSALDDIALQGQQSIIEFVVIQINEKPMYGNICEFSILGEAYTLSGSIEYYHNWSSTNNSYTPVSEVVLEVNSLVDIKSYEGSTGNNGFYSISGITPTDYELDIAKNSLIGLPNYFDGLSATDASRALRYLSDDIEYHLTEDQRLAASLGYFACFDNDRDSEPVSDSEIGGPLRDFESCDEESGQQWLPFIESDIPAKIAKYSIGIDDNLYTYNDLHWLFKDKDNNLLLNHATGEVIPYEFTIANSNIEGVDFTGVRLGDVSGNWSRPPSGSRSIPQEIASLNKDIKDGNIVKLPIYIPEELSIEGLDLELEFDQEYLKFVRFDDFGNLNNENYITFVNNKDDGFVKLASFAKRMPIDQSGVLGEVVFEIISAENFVSRVQINEIEVNEIIVGGFKLDDGPDGILYGGVDIIHETSPSKFELHQNYPNPFNPITHINFDLVDEMHVKIWIVDMRGALVVELINNIFESGFHKVTWDAQEQASGIYFVNMVAGEGLYTNTQKMVLIK